MTLPAGAGTLAAPKYPPETIAMLRRLISLLLVVFAIAGPVRAEDTKTTLTLAVAANMATCIEAIDAEFIRRHPGLEIKVATGASGNFFAQIRNGAPFEVFVSADMDFPRKLVEAGLADGKTFRPYAVGRLALWTNTPGINPGRGRALFGADYVKKIAIANPDTAPYGRAAMAALENLGVISVAKDKLVTGESVAQAVQFVQTGAAEIGFVPYSMVSTPPLKGVGQYVAMPAGSYPPIEQGVVVTARGAGNPLAAEFVAFMGSEIARAMLEESGYGLPGDAAAK